MVARLSILVGRLQARLEDLKREDGQTTVEYAVVVALVIGLAVAAFGFLGPSINTFMSGVGTKIASYLPL